MRHGETFKGIPPVSAPVLEELAAEYAGPESTTTESKGTTTDNELTDSERTEFISIVSEGWKDGYRHRFGLGVPGLLWHRGVPLEQALSITEELSTNAGDTNTADRLKACRDTYTIGEAGKPVAWRETLKENLSAASMTALYSWIEALEERTGEDEPPTEWQYPVSLSKTEGPELDPRVLPEDLRTFGMSKANALQMPLDMVVTAMLGTISSAVIGRYIASGRWKERAHIMVINVALPGSRKSALMSDLTRPVYRFQKEIQAQDRLALAEWESVHRTLKRQQDSLEREPRKGEPEGESRDLQRRAAVQELHEHEEKKPVITTLIVDDVTPEKTAWMLTEQPGLTVTSAESAFLENFTRYGDSPNFDPFLKGHAGDSITIHRRSGEEATTESACLGLNIAIQPEALIRMGNVQGFGGRGGDARLLMTVARDMVGSRLTGASVPQMPEHLSEWWDRKITGMLERRAELETPAYIHFSQEASDAINDFEAQCEARVKAGGKDYPMRAWVLKQAGAAIRLAALLHLVDNTHNEPITAETMQRGIALSEWYRAHAEVAFAMMSESQDDIARIVWEALSENGELEVSRRDLHQRLKDRSAFKRSKDLDEPLTILEEYGYIRTRKEGTGGRPTVIIELNPLALKNPEPETPLESPRTERTPAQFTSRIVEVI